MNINGILKELEQLVGDTSPIVVGFSGGLDSSVLLHIMSRSRFKSRVTALHVNHGLSDNSDAWADHCQRQCGAWAIPLKVECVVVENKGGGLEEAARDARYEVFERHADSFACRDASTLDGNGVFIATGHHANDQAETVLFRLFRGTGIKGLAGIQPFRATSSGTQVIRPLLPVSRSDLEQYAQGHSISFVEDESNKDEAFDRNYLRHKVVPVVQQRWPQVLDHLKNLSRRAAENTGLLTEYALDDLKACDEKPERVGFSLDIETFSLYSPARQHLVIREWAYCYGFDMPLPAHLDQVSLLLNASEGSNPAVEWGQSALSTFRNRLFLLPRSILKSDTVDNANTIAWNTAEPCCLPDGFKLDVLVETTASDIANDELSSLQIRFRNGGERCKPLNRDRSQTLKKLLQEYELEPWLRYKVPLVYKGEDLIAVGDLFWCQCFPSASISWVFDKDASK